MKFKEYNDCLYQSVHNKRLAVCRRVVAGRDPVHAGVRPGAVPGDQRQRDAHHDHGLQVLRSTPHLGALHKVSNKQILYSFYVQQVVSKLNVLI